MTDNEVKEELERAVMELIRTYPFYGHVLAQLPKIFLDDTKQSPIKTMAVGKSKGELLVKLYVHIPFIKSIFEKANCFTDGFNSLVEIVKHEILHIVLYHLTLALPDKDRFAIACECEVNSYCNPANFPKVEGTDNGGVTAESYDLETKKSVYYYYNELLNNEKFKEQMKDKNERMKQLKQALKDGNMKPGNSDDMSIQDLIDSHDLWEAAKEDPMLEQMLKDVVRKSAEICNQTGQWGNIPSNLQEQIEQSVVRQKPLIPWQRTLRMFVASATECELNYTMKRRSRRFGTRPGTRKDEVLNLAIGIDVSGSVSNEQLKTFFNELYWMSKNGCKITVFEADTKIQREYPFEKFDGAVEGRGGTTLDPILEETSKRKFDALIYFTDFDAPNVEKKYNIPVLWVISQSWCYRNGERPYKWGHVIEIDKIEDFN